MTIHDDAGGLFMAAMINCMIVASGDPDHLMETIPVSAGITGSLLAGLKSRQSDGSNRYQWVVAVISGVATAIFCGPMLASNVLGFTSVKSITFLYFILGLLGSTFVDLVIENRLIITNWFIRKSASNIVDPPIPPTRPGDK